MKIYPLHIQHIISNYSEHLLRTLKNEKVNSSLEKAMDVFIAADPTERKTLVDWLVKTYVSTNQAIAGSKRRNEDGSNTSQSEVSLNSLDFKGFPEAQGGFRWEDIAAGEESKLAELLRNYLTYFNQIPKEQRDIYQYKSYGETYSMLKPHLPVDVEDHTVSGKEIKRRERVKALEESYIVHRDERIVMAVPLTQEASCWWGRGTKWCTAAQKNNYFDKYNQEAPLLVINLLGSGEKFQLWIKEEDFQFVDATDSEVNPITIEKYWDCFQPVMEWAVEQNARALGFIPEHLRIEELCKLALKQNGAVLFLVPQHLKTLELCKIAIEQNGRALCHVPRHLKTFDICKIAVEQNGLALGYVPQSSRTAELCKIAVKQNVAAYGYVPEDLQTEELQQLSLESNKKEVKWNISNFFTLQQKLASKDVCCTQALTKF